VPLKLVAPDSVEFANFRKHLAQASDLLRDAVPEIAEELDALVGEVVVATVEETDDSQVFDGISAFDLWSALVINPRRHETVLETAEVLVHEAAHSLLFGYCLDEPLVLNPPTDRFTSPVRADPRPMDGVFHGTYVIAALHYLYQRLTDSDALSLTDRQALREMLAEYHEPFTAGIKVIREHGILTETGRRIVDGAEAYMAASG